MTDQRNLIIAIVVSIAIVMSWQFLIVPPAPPAPAPQATQSTPQPGGAPPIPGGAPAVPGSPPVAGAPAAAPGAKPPAPAFLDRDTMLKTTARVGIDTPELAGSIALKGGRLDDLLLKHHRQKVDAGSPPVILLAPEGARNPYYIEYGWVGAQGQTIVLPGPETVWTADRAKLTPDQPVTLTWNNGAGLVFALRYEIDAHFMVTVTQRVTNGGAAPVTLIPYALASRHGKPDAEGLFILHEGPYGVFDGTLKELSYSDLKDKTQSIPTTGGWIGITDKYWMATLIPDQQQRVTARFLHTLVNNVERYQIDYVGAAQTVAPGGGAETTNRAYTGAKIVGLVNDYREKLGIQRFDLVIDWGWFFFFTKPLFWLLDYLFKLIGNFGLSIMALTVLVKLAMFPLANKSYRAMSKMKALAPQMTKLKERFGEDRQKLNQEMMALYKKEKVNPAAGCLPIVVQIPVFFALYKVLYVTIEMRHQPFYGWIKDLSAPDPATILTGFGMIDWHVPGLLQFFNIGIWPLIMGVTMFLQQRLNPQPTDPIQAKIFLWMPIMFTFILAPFAAGLVIYWAWNNTLSILQQYVIMRRMGVPIGTPPAEPAPAPAAGGKGGKKR